MITKIISHFLLLLWGVTLISASCEELWRIDRLSLIVRGISLHFFYLVMWLERNRYLSYICESSDFLVLLNSRCFILTRKVKLLEMLSLEVLRSSHTAHSNSVSISVMAEYILSITMQVWRETPVVTVKAPHKSFSLDALEAPEVIPDLASSTPKTCNWIT